MKEINFNTFEPMALVFKIFRFNLKFLFIGNYQFPRPHATLPSILNKQIIKTYNPIRPKVRNIKIKRFKIGILK